MYGTIIMKNNTNRHRLIKVILTISFSFWISACSFQKTETLAPKIKIETINSANAQITSSYIKVNNDKWILYGKVARKHRRRGPIPGHLHVEIVDSNNQVTHETTLQYKRKRVQSTYANFSLVIPFQLPPESRLRVIHHDVFSHNN